MTPICIVCGRKNLANARFCHWCGTGLSSTPDVMLTGYLPSRSMLHRGRYVILEQVGKGGMGAVYKAQDLELKQRLVAIKEMSQSGLNAQELQESIAAFTREAELLTQLKHQSLPSVYGQFEEHGRRYLVMEYIEGETLEQRLETLEQQGKRLSVEEVLSIARQLCIVLDYLHTRRPPIVFRDLKPGNIMLNQQGQIYLIDFGIARLFNPARGKDTVALGSPGYAPPEQYRGASSPRSDIYSLGITLHQMLTGEDPTEQPFHLKTLSIQMPALEQLVMSMIELDERKRPEHMSSVLTMLEQLDHDPAKVQIRKSNPASWKYRNGYTTHLRSAPAIPKPLIITTVLSPHEQDRYLWKSIQQQFLPLIDGFPQVEIRTEPAGQIETIETAHLIVLLISAEFFASAECMAAMERALERSDAQEARVLGVILRACPVSEILQAQLELIPEDAVVHRSRYAQEQRIGEVAKTMRARLAASLMSGRTIGPMTLLQWLLWQLYGNGFTTCRNFLIGDGQRGRYALSHVRPSGLASVLLHLVDLQKHRVTAELLIGPLRCRDLTRLLQVVAPFAGNDPELVQGIATRQRPVW